MKNNSICFFINKEKNLTSYDECLKLKKKGYKKVGHCGTLDPFATGLMIICTNNATKALTYMNDFDKEYQGIIRFGFSTDTFDSTGKKTNENNNFTLSIKKIEKIIEKHFIGNLEQTPPIFSAKKINGERAYSLARNDENFELKKQKIKIKKFDIFENDETSVKFLITVSKGTYIRSIANDLGKKLQIPSHLEKLVRTKIDNFSLNDVDENFISIKKILKMNLINVNNKKQKDLINGKIVDISLSKLALAVNNNFIIGVVENMNGKAKLKRGFLINEDF